MTNHEDRLRQIEAELARIPRDILVRFFTRSAYVSRLASAEVNYIPVTGSTFCNKDGTLAPFREGPHRRKRGAGDRSQGAAVLPDREQAGTLRECPASWPRPSPITRSCSPPPTAPAPSADQALVPIDFWSEGAEPDLYELTHWSYTAERPLDIDVTVRTWAVARKPGCRRGVQLDCTVEGSQLVNIGG